MTPSRRELTLAVAVLIAIGADLGVVGYTAFKIGEEWGRSLELSELTFVSHELSGIARLPQHRRLILALRNAFGFGKPLYHSSYGQDQWIMEVVFPDVRSGFYVDVGSGDGILQSNSKALDELGWRGICIDPYPTGMKTRSARLFKEVVYSEAGHKIRFQPNGFTGGIEDHFNRTKGWHDCEKSETVEFVTTTLDDILSRAQAPGFIEYMSIDIEGAELEALKGLSFTRYKVGAFTIEHNWEEPKRSEIRQLLEGKGYRYAFPRGRDDFYIYSGLLRRTEVSGFQ